MQIDIEALLARVDKYSAKTGAPEWKIGKALFLDASTLPRLRTGWRGIGVDRLERAAHRLAELEKARAKKKSRAA